MEKLKAKIHEAIPVLAAIQPENSALRVANLTAAARAAGAGEVVIPLHDAMVLIVALNFTTDLAKLSILELRELLGDDLEGLYKGAVK
jgi:hypothetical protein